MQKLVARGLFLPDNGGVMNANLLDILCCPVTHQPLRMADTDTLRRASEKTSAALTEGLLREDGQVLYPVSGGIPLLVPEEGIAL